MTYPLLHFLSLTAEVSSAYRRSRRVAFLAYLGLLSFTSLAFPLQMLMHASGFRSISASIAYSGVQWLAAAFCFASPAPNLSFLLVIHIVKAVALLHRKLEEVINDSQR